MYAAKYPFEVESTNRVIWPRGATVSGSYHGIAFGGVVRHHLGEAVLVELVLPSPGLPTDGLPAMIGIIPRAWGDQALTVVDGAPWTPGVKTEDAIRRDLVEVGNAYGFEVLDAGTNAIRIRTISGRQIATLVLTGDHPNQKLIVLEGLGPPILAPAPRPWNPLRLDLDPQSDADVDLAFAFLRAVHEDRRTWDALIMVPGQDIRQAVGRAMKAGQEAFAFRGIGDGPEPRFDAKPGAFAGDDYTVAAIDGRLTRILTKSPLVEELIGLAADAGGFLTWYPTPSTIGRAPTRLPSTGSTFAIPTFRDGRGRERFDVFPIQVGQSGDHAIGYIVRDGELYHAHDHAFRRLGAAAQTRATVWNRIVGAWNTGPASTGAAGRPGADGVVELGKSIRAWAITNPGHAAAPLGVLVDWNEKTTRDDWIAFVAATLFGLGAIWVDAVPGGLGIAEDAQGRPHRGTLVGVGLGDVIFAWNRVQANRRIAELATGKGRGA